MFESARTRASSSSPIRSTPRRGASSPGRTRLPPASTVSRSVGRPDARSIWDRRGTQALLAARHCEHVVAVDVNDRAIELARLNAELKRFENVEFRRGDWFGPVAGERFDLIVSNPPYVVSPRLDLLYRDGSLVADDVTRMLIGEVPTYLEEGGIAQVMGNWAHGADEDWRAPLSRGSRAPAATRCCFASRAPISCPTRPLELRARLQRGRLLP